MRPTWGPAPHSSVLARLSLDILVRDYPETLAVLRRRGADPRDYGGERLADLAGTALLPELMAALAWRNGS